MSVLLSIAIPTYNFGRFIGETLASIVPQTDERIEIVILDGGSTDDTAAVVADWQARCPQIVYHRQPQRGGIDRDMARVADLSRGQYMWLFSADDLMRPGAVARILVEIESGLEVYLGTHSHCGFDMRLIAPVHPVLAEARAQQFNLGDQRDRARYFRQVRTTEALFSFLGTIIVRKDFWNEQPFEEQFAGTCWAHAARLMRLMDKGMRLKFLPEPLLDKRGDNDSFATSGPVKRAALAIDGYLGIAERVFGANTPALAAARRALSNEFTFRILLYMKIHCLIALPQELDDLNQLVARLHRAPSVRLRLRQTAYAAFSPTLLYGMRDARRWLRRRLQGPGRTAQT